MDVCRDVDLRGPGLGSWLRDLAEAWLERLLTTNYTVNGDGPASRCLGLDPVVCGPHSDRESERRLESVVYGGSFHMR